MKTKSRLIHYFLTSLVVASALTTAISPAVSAKAASDMSPTEIATSWIYYNALSACIQNNKLLAGFNSDSLPEAEAQSGRWFYNAGLNNPTGGGGISSGTNPTIGYFLTGTGLKTDGTGRVGCGGDNTDWIIDAAKLWGYSNGIDLLCDTGAVRKDGSKDCRAGHGDFTGDPSITVFNGFSLYTTPRLNLSKFRTNVGGRVYNSPDPSLTDPSQYVLYGRPLLGGCIGNGNATPDLYIGSATSTTDSRVYELTNVDTTTGVQTPVKYYGLKDGSENIDYAVNSDLSTAHMLCQDMASKMNSYAGAYSAYITLNPGRESKAATAATKIDTPNAGTASCTIDGIGWIVCPVVKFLATISAGAFGVLADNFLKTNTAIFDTSQPTYTAWSAMRNIANVAFVVAFLIIIFSQLTSVGITNYGVKKMLPRLIIAAILVNISYFICQIAVDLSNILGYSLKDFFAVIGNTAIPAGTSQAATATGFIGVTGDILAVAGTGLIGYALLSTLIPVLLAGVIALIMIMFILVARQALIIILLVISPIAFVAYLLPNTEQWFKKWQKTFTAMLMLFPIVAVVFGGSSLASTILANTFNGNFGSGELEANKMFGQVIAMAVMVLPLFVIPGLLKKSLDSIPALGRLAGKLSSSANNNVSKKAKESYQSSLYGRGSAIRKQARKNYQDRQFAGRLNKSGKVGTINTVLAGGTSSIPFSKIGKPNSGLRKFAEKHGGQAIAEQQALKRAATGVAATAMSDEAKQEKELLRQQVGGNAETVFNHIQSNMDTMSDAQMQGATELLIESKGAKYVRQLVGNSHFMQRHARSIAETGRRNDPNLRAQAPDLANFLGDPSASSGQALHGVTDTAGEVSYSAADEVKIKGAYDSLGADRIAALDDGSAKIAASRYYLDPVVAKAVHEDTTAANPVSAKTRKVLSTYYP